MKLFLKRIFEFLKNLRPVLSIDSGTGYPSVAIELNKKIEINNKEIEDRISQLDDVREKLILAADAINIISDESKQKKTELDLLRKRLDQINRDKEEAEKLLEVDQESFARLLLSTDKQREKRSILIGIGIGFITGTLSSILVWWLTTLNNI